MPTGDLLANPTLQVLMKQNWTDSWSAVSYLTALRASKTVGPTFSRAEFLYDYGVIKREDANLYADVDHLEDRTGWFIQIRDITAGGDGTHLWTGVVMQEELRPQDPVDSVSTGDQASGDQVLIAYGLEVLLDMVPWFGSVCTVPGGGYVKINDVLTFNERHRHGLGQVGNRSSAKFTVQGREIYIFSDGNTTPGAPGDPLDPPPWTATDIIDYMLATMAPQRVRFVLAGATTIPTIMVPRALNPSGRTVKSVLDHLIDRRHGVAYRLDPPTDVADTGSDVTITVVSTLDADISFQGEIIPANTVQANLNIDDDLTVDPVAPFSLLNDSLVKYDWIVVRGARLKCCFSVGSAHGGFLRPAWRTDDQIDYERELDDDARSVDKYSSVFRAFRINESSFDWTTHTGDAQGQGVVVPLVDPADGSVDLTKHGPTKVWGHTFLRELPLVERWDASLGAVEFRRPFALILVDDVVSGLIYSTWHYMDQLAAIDLSAYSLRPMTNGFGFIVNSSKMPHTLALNSVSPGNDMVTDVYPEVDYQDMVITGAVESDEVLRVSVQVTTDPQADPLTAPIGRLLMIDVPDAEFWFIADQTVLDVEPVTGALIHQQGAAVLRDDSPRLRRIAAMAKAWHSRRRQAGVVGLIGITNSYPAGSVLKTISSSIVRGDLAGSLVTFVDWDFVGFRTTITTAFEELDLSAF